MKKTFKILTALSLCLVLMLGLCTAAFAESSVDYQGGAEKFVFLEGSEYSATDLFQGFKGVMPGDEISQNITVRNSFTGVESVKIYLRALPLEETENPVSPDMAKQTASVSMEDFLSQLSMTVKQGDKVIFQASPAELDGLKDNVLLGTFTGKAETVLTVTLSVPIELGNEYMDQVGEVNWLFTAEEIPASDKPKTGDESNAVLWISIMAICLIAAAAIMFFFYRKKKKAQ